MQNLARVECDLEASEHFYDYYAMDQDPKVFSWPVHSPFQVEYYRMMEKDNSEWKQRWKQPILSGVSYAKDHVPNTIIDDHFVRLDRLAHSFHLYILRRAANIDVASLKQITEFGGGTGDMVPFVREMGFRGTHFVVDLPPLLLLQRYFQLLSSWPSYLVASTKAGLFGRKTLLVNAKNISELTSTFDSALYDLSAFIATYSFTETTSSDRAAYIQKLELSKYGYLLIAAQNNVFDVDNVQYLANWARDLKKTHNTCLWRTPVFPGGVHFVAVKKTLSDASCDGRVGCNAATKVHGECLALN